MLQHYISSFLLYVGVIFILVGLYSFYFLVLGILLIAISPKIQDHKYEYKKWEEKYLSKT